MAFPVASAGTTPPIWPTGSAGNNLSATGFIPEIWSGKMIEKFYHTTVLGAISNTDYEGEIKQYGDKVIIRTKPTIIINDYRADGLLAVQRPTGNFVELNIDKGKYFNTALDDVMEKQSDINNLSLWADDAAEQMKITIDTDVLLGLFNQAASTNRGEFAGAISGDINLGLPVADASASGPLAVVPRSPGTGEVEIVDVLLRLGQALDEQNIPESGRWAIIPAWAGTMIKMSELRQVYLTGDNVTMLRNGRLGMIDRFTIYISNLLPKGPVATTPALAAGEWVIYAGHAHGLTFASQMTNVETMRSELSFANLLRGLQVFGWKVLDSIALAQAVVTKA